MSINQLIEIRPKPKYKLTKGWISFETLWINGVKYLTLLIKCGDDCQ